MSCTHEEKLRRRELQVFVGATFSVAPVSFLQNRIPSHGLDRIPHALQLRAGCFSLAVPSSFVFFIARQPHRLCSCFFHQLLGEVQLAPVQVWTSISLDWPLLAAP